MDWHMSHIITGALLFVAGYAFGRISKALAIARDSRARWTPNLNIEDVHIETAVRSGNKIEAIRLYRQRNGAGLKEAMQAVEAIAHRINVRF